MCPKISLDKREYPKGEGVRMKTQAKDFKLLRPNGHLLLSKLIFVHINFKSALAMFLNISKIAY